MFSLNCKGKLVLLYKPLIMGIINVNQDSFYTGSRVNSEDDIVKKATQMINEGADILDIGGQSTRPGSKRISAGEELSHVLPAIKLITEKFQDVIISIDTFDADVAKKAVSAGASIVNDISAGEMDNAMIETVASLEVPYIAMHMKGVPETMQQQAIYDDVTKEVFDFFIKKIDQCQKAGIKDVIIDPGFGFGKNISHNFTLLKNLSLLKLLDVPILAGISRKGTIYKTLNISADEALNGTTVINTIALQNGATILRVHDVKEAKEIAILLEAYRNA
ncbi:MAG: dihydropteroate synthase [Bacteroidota bacterium]|nr:dihydropteroate synthase [Bacteroidota bacterium]